MYWQNQRAGIRDGAKELPTRRCRLLRIPVEDRGPVWFTALQRVMHHVARHRGALSTRPDVHAAMARRMPGRRRQPHRIIERIVVIDQQRLACRNDRLSVEPPDIARRLIATRRRSLPRRVLAL